MKVLFISRKSFSDIGGLSRFYFELATRFPNSSFGWSIRAPLDVLKISFSRIDLIHLCDATVLPLGVFLKWLLKKPLTLTAHGLDLAFSNPLYQRMLKVLLPKADGVILDSHPALSLIAPFELPKNKIFVIPPGISLRHLEESYYFPLPPLLARIVLLTVGDLVLRKGHAWFLENVLRKLPREFIYLIVGDGPERKNIERVIFDFDLSKRVYLLGRIAHPELSFILKKADIYVCPNQKVAGNFEGFGIALGEAAAFGLPVVASKVDGIPEIIKDGKNGWLVEPEPDSFISALLKLKDSFLRKKIGSKAKEYTKRNYKWEKTIEAYMEVFEHLNI